MAQAECGSRPWIAVHFSPATWPDGFRETVVADLQASLGERDIDVCPAQTRSQSLPLAHITLTVPRKETVRIGVVARDAKAQQQFTREVSLSEVPRDGRAFAIALATDELISAGWEELALLPLPKDKKQSTSSSQAAEPPATEAADDRDASAPGDVSSALEDEPDPPADPRAPPGVALGVFGMAEIFASGQRYAGAEVRVRAALGETFDDAPWSLEGALAAAVGSDVDVAGFGQVEADAQVAGVWLRYAMSQTRTVGFGAAAGTRLGTYRFVGTPNASAQQAGVSGADVSEPFWSGEFKLDAEVSLAGPLYFSAALGFAIPIIDVEARLDGQAVTAASRFTFNPSAGLFLQW